MNSLILIPSAKLIPIELQAEFGPIPSAMIPLSSHTALDYITGCYNKNSTFLIAVNESGNLIKSYCLKHLNEFQIMVFDVGYTTNLGQTIINALNSIKVLPDQLILNFADTAVQDTIPQSGDFIFYSKPRDLFRWTTFSLSNQNKISFLIDKDHQKNASKVNNAFIGVFGMKDILEFKQILKGELKAGSMVVDPFFNAVIRYFNGKESVEFFETKFWFDFGHLDTYYESKKKLSEGCRNFNSISVDSVRGIISKRSQNTEKFIKEIEWYLKLPSKIQYIAPRVFDYSLNFTNPYVSLEFYGYPPLSDLYLFGNLDMGAWTRIFDSINQVLFDMHQFLVQPQSKESFVKSMKEIYENKTLERMRDYIYLPEFLPFHKKLKIDNRELFSLMEINEMLPELLERIGIYNDPKFTIIHGDFCLSNILYDRRNGIVRLIDPRGKFGEFDIFGDYRYDLCKLGHSLYGDYDFLVNGLFDCNIHGNELQLHPHLSKHHLKVKQLYMNWEAIWSIEEVNKIRILESLLFLSMVPLHKDRPKSQFAFVIRGLQIFSETIKELL